MASKVINTILNLKDNMSGKMLKVSSSVKGLTKEQRRASMQSVNMMNKFNASVNSMINKGAKIAGIGATIASGFAIKTGLSEALDLEGYRMQLETATKDSVKAGEIMKYAIDLANRTPFEGGELVEGAAKLEAMGLSAQQWLPKIGDMAAATNKPFDQAIEAFIDAQTGELERMKEFGVKKADIAQKANEMFAGQEVINQKGQIVDYEKFNQAMVAVMENRFVGGMEKQSQTLRGTWSTITGVTKSALSEMVGMTSDGTIKQGSLLDTFKGKIQEIANKFMEWQSDGTLQSLSDKFTSAFNFIYDVVSKVVNFIVENREIIGFFISLFAGLAIGIKVVAGLKMVMTGLQIAWALLNGTIALSPLGWIVVAITAVVAAGYLLITNWDWIKTKAFELWNGFVAAFGGLGDFFSGLWGGISSGFKWFVNGLIDGLNWAIEGINELCNIKVPDWVPGIGGQGFSLNIPTIPHFALGTNYFKGGLAQINERGGEIVNLPNGSKVIPSDKSDKMLNSGVNVQVIIQGNVIGNEEFANYTGNVIANKVILALGNM